MAEDIAFEEAGFELKKEIDMVFARSLAIRELDCGSDNSPEIELNNLCAPHYDVERFGVYFVASPRHADILMVTGPVTKNMAEAAKRTYEAMPEPKLVVAVGDDACGRGIFNESPEVLGGAEKLFSVDMKIPGDPPTPYEIIQGLLSLIREIKEHKNR